MGCALHGHEKRNSPGNRFLVGLLRDVEEELEARCPDAELLAELSRVIYDLEVRHPKYDDLPGGRITRSDKFRREISVD
jgi:hypothetical protein